MAHGLRGTWRIQGLPWGTKFVLLSTSPHIYICIIVCIFLHMLLPLEYLQKHLFAAHTSCSQPTAAVEIGRLFLKRSLPIRTRDARIANYSKVGKNWFSNPRRLILVAGVVMLTMWQPACPLLTNQWSWTMTMAKVQCQGSLWVEAPNLLSFAKGHRTAGHSTCKKKLVALKTSDFPSSFPVWLGMTVGIQEYVCQLSGNHQLPDIIWVVQIRDSWNDRFRPRLIIIM